MKKGISIIIIILVISGFIVFVRTIEKAEFINVRPSMKMGNIEYVVTGEIVLKDKLNKQVGKVTKILELVSYFEKDNPYKKPSRIFEIKNKNIRDEVALEMNDKLYVAKFVGYISEN